MAAECKVEGCDRIPNSRALVCSGHYQRRRNHGDYLAHIPLRSVRRLPVVSAEVLEVDPAEVLEIAMAPAPSPGRGFLWLV
jgi:hypothetical protein